MAEINTTTQNQCLTFQGPDGILAHAELLAERMVWLPESRTLLAADLHWGKAQTFRHYGIPIPHGVLEADLARLSETVSQKQAERILVLGDLVHHSTSLTPYVLETVSRWRNGPVMTSVSLALVKGNHDRHWQSLPEDWRITIHNAPLLEGCWAFDHEPGTAPSHFLWAGHVHPVVRVSGGIDSLRLPCFGIHKHYGLLPAFSYFTGGFLLDAKDYQGIYVIAENHVIPLQTPDAPFQIPSK